MLVSRGGDYAIRAMVDLASRPGEERTITQGIADRQQIPPAFLSKVLASLTQAGLARTHRGAAGGVGLARSPEGISLLEVVKAVQGPIILNECTDPYRTCPLEDTCAVSQVWREAQKNLEELLGSAYLSQFAKAD
ncbi:MAG TPA: Rrf2 family transcriptional regulator [Chloroflexi bacterium]|nr:Rrf2 family transcriptional regulator [Chloroflexota bacterium]